MLPPIPITLLITGNFEPRFVDKNSWLKRVPVAFTRQPVRGETEQLVIDQRQQFRFGLRITLMDAFENVGSLTHGSMPLRLPEESSAGDG